MAIEPPGGTESYPFDDKYQALPPLGSDEYLAYLRMASRQDLPPEVLVRAFRQLPPGGPAARATLERLFRMAGDRYENLTTVYRRVERLRMDRSDEPRDLVQDTLRKILGDLPTPSGDWAARAWSAYCRRRVSDAWRERYGRRGERLTLEPLPVTVDTEGKTHDPVDHLEYPYPWMGEMEGAKADRLMALIEIVLSALPSDFLREVATAAWLDKSRPKVSGRAKPGSPLPLTKRFPDKSRDQINRALRQAEAQLAAAMIADGTFDFSVDELKALQRINNASK